MARRRRASTANRIAGQALAPQPKRVSAAYQRIMEIGMKQGSNVWYVGPEPDELTTAEQVVVWAIVTLFFVVLLAGIGFSLGAIL